MCPVDQDARNWITDRITENNMKRQGKVKLERYFPKSNIYQSEKTSRVIVLSSKNSSYYTGSRLCNCFIGARLLIVTFLLLLDSFLFFLRLMNLFLGDIPLGVIPVTVQMALCKTNSWWFIILGRPKTNSSPDNTFSSTFSNHAHMVVINNKRIKY